MPRNAEQAIAYARQEHDRPSRDWSGWCLIFVRTCFGVGASAPSAIAAWNSARHKHPTTDPHSIPRGVPVMFAGGEFGHIVISAGDGMCWSTDILRPGKVDRVPISVFAQRWGQRLLGWTEDLNGVRVYTPPAPKPPKRSRGKAVDHAIHDTYVAKRRAQKAGQHKREGVLTRALKVLRRLPNRRVG